MKEKNKIRHIIFWLVGSMSFGQKVSWSNVLAESQLLPSLHPTQLSSPQLIVTLLVLAFWPTIITIMWQLNVVWSIDFQPIDVALSISCKIFEYFALQVDPVIGFMQCGSTPFKDSAILLPKLADPPFWWKSNSAPSKTGSGLPNPDQLIFCTI